MWIFSLNIEKTLGYGKRSYIMIVIANTRNEVLELAKNTDFVIDICGNDSYKNAKVCIIGQYIGNEKSPHILCSMVSEELDFS